MRGVLLLSIALTTITMDFCWKALYIEIIGNLQKRWVLVVEGRGYTLSRLAKSTENGRPWFGPSTWK